MQNKNRVDLDLYALCTLCDCARHFPKCFTHSSSFNPHNNPVKEVLLLSPSYIAKYKLRIFFFNIAEFLLKVSLWIL